MISINELAEEMKGKGYKITPRTIKYYVEEGFLPNTMKIGGYREGVKLVFPDKISAVSRLKRIFELKGRGYKLSEIKTEIKLELNKTAEDLRKKDLSRYTELDGRFYKIVDKELLGNMYLKGKSLSDLLRSLSKKIESEWFDPDFFGGIVQIEDLKSIENRNLYQPIFICQDNPVHYVVDVNVFVSSWVKLHNEYSFSWNQLEAFHKAHTENFKKFETLLPEIDDCRFTNAWIGYYRQQILNQFPELLLNYLILIRNGFVSYNDSYNIRGQQNEMFTTWDSKYDSVDCFIEDFLNGKCAFVPSLEIGDERASFFLRRF